MNAIVFSICLNAGCAVLAPNGLWWQGQCVFGPCNEQRVAPRPPVVRPPHVERRLPPRAHAEPPPPVAPDAPPSAAPPLAPPPAAPPQRAPDDQLEGGPEVPLTPSVPSHPPPAYRQR